MRKKKWKSIDALYEGLSDNHQQIVDLLRFHMKTSGGKEVLQRNSLVRKFPNGTWRYLNTYSKKDPVLGCSHVNRLIDMHPATELAFDEIKKYVGKILLVESEDIEKKNIELLVKLLADLDAKKSYV